ncbi:dihydrodipicolinate synthase family protein [Anaerococcus sp. NML200537]|uniref:dihydrodipicolinate synthase family protein n=1 Tax=Anaerococcus sp. NML200537 TaxID=2954485 RepID=UPI002238BC67|nr:dihydrodipicolinate synthase family protein [Anaerococcus sp. NML200537]MCW6700555.1 dihydrodipicolinate synthase family protein [Anaerococcus sp. NML200537]
MSEFTLKDFRGVIPASLSIFDENENLDLEATKEFTEFLLKFDIGGLYLTGSTGEGFLMSAEEREKSSQAVIEVAKGKVPVVVHIGDIGTKKSIDLAKAAEEAGATAISSVPPFYWRFNSEQIYDYYKDIAEAVDIPMVIYNVPLAGMMSADMIKDLSQIENIKGVKYTNSDIYQIPAIKEACGEDFMVYGGADELASSNLLIGVDGIVGSFYNLIPDLFIQINEAIANNEVKKAYDLQKNAVRIINYLVAGGNMVAGIKAVLREAGINAGYARRPFINFYGDDQVKLAKGLVELANKYEMKDIYVIDKLREKY